MRRSVAIVLDSKGTGELELGALAALADVQIVRAEVVRGQWATCVALTVDHPDPPDQLRRRLGDWAGPRGWSVTIAPVAGAG
jgi:hypothetical protein